MFAHLALRVAVCVTCFVCTVNTAWTAEGYTDQQLLTYYGLEQNVSLDKALRIFPPAPAPFEGVLSTSSDPLLQKKIAEMSDEEIDQVVKNSALKINDFWRGVFAARGRAYGAAEIRMTSANIRYATDGIWFDESTGRTGTVRVNRTSLRRIARPTTTGILISAMVAHEIAHSVAVQLRLDDGTGRNAAAKIKKILAERPELPKYPFVVYVELQANYLAGIALRHAGLLREGDPSEVYYGTALSGDDFELLIPGLGRPKKNPEHGRGKDQAAMIYEGMQTGDVEKGLRFLGIDPVWSQLSRN